MTGLCERCFVSAHAEHTDRGAIEFLLLILLMRHKLLQIKVPSKVFFAFIFKQFYQIMWQRTFSVIIESITSVQRNRRLLVTLCETRLCNEEPLRHNTESRRLAFANAGATCGKGEIEGGNETSRITRTKFSNIRVIVGFFFTPSTVSNVTRALELSVFVLFT
jgi:hypothetical protein